ncbi:hypothetical protein [uncultured Lamprocystis sp.]|uniref:hypothetical protein n=1 Tax=uncultured Lamprocystis sp. TaxID=543132 RepID=UPI0025EBB58E|nr:hypothetical protein [uncultured Lamprocystis sp.]
MITYLTTEHGPVPPHVTLNGMSYPTELAIQRGEAAYLAPLGIFPHEVPDGPAPFGHDWELIDGTYVGTPAGSEEDRAAALAAQEHLRLRREVWPEQTRQRNIRAANAVLADPNATSNQRIEALKTLNTL